MDTPSEDRDTPRHSSPGNCGNGSGLMKNRLFVDIKNCAGGPSRPRSQCRCSPMCNDEYHTVTRILELSHPSSGRPVKRPTVHGGKKKGLEMGEGGEIYTVRRRPQITLLDLSRFKNVRKVIQRRSANSTDCSVARWTQIA